MPATWPYRRYARTDGHASLTQFVVTPGIIDLSWGMPDPTLLPVEQLRTAANCALDRYGPAALAYGSPQGPAPLIEFITHRLAQTDARPPTPQEVLVTSGASQGLDLAASMVLEPGYTALVEFAANDLVIVEDDTYREVPRRPHRGRLPRGDGVRAPVARSVAPEKPLIRLVRFPLPLARQPKRGSHD
jgi:DNA-binding transcriptional MocR family regulator